MICIECGHCVPLTGETCACELLIHPLPGPIGYPFDGCHVPKRERVGICHALSSRGVTLQWNESAEISYATLIECLNSTRSSELTEQKNDVVKRLRQKSSRDNRALLDAAAYEICRLEDEVKMLRKINAGLLLRAQLSTKERDNG